MRSTSRSELLKLRELVHFLLAGKLCIICGKPLSPTAEAFKTHGNATGPKLIDQLTVHHRDGNHHNNEHNNKAIVHRSCHKSHEMKLRQLRRFEVQEHTDD